MKTGYYKLDDRWIVYYDAAENKIYDFGQKIAHWVDDLSSLAPVNMVPGDKFIRLINDDPYYDLGLQISLSLGNKI